MDSGRPVLMIPYIGAAKTLGERILIAWKDSRESARAVADALPLLKDAKAVLAIAVSPRGDESVQEYVSDKAVEGFLRRHDVDATVNRMVAPDIGSQGVFETVDAPVVAVAVMLECGTFALTSDAEYEAAAAEALYSGTERQPSDIWMEPSL